MQEFIIAARYAHAIAQVVDAKRWDNAIEELSAFDGVLTEYPVVRQYLTSPLIGEQEKQVLLEKILGCTDFSEEIVNTIHLILKKNRMLLFSHIIVAFIEIIEDIRNMDTVHIRCATSLSDADILRIVEKLSDKTNKKLKCKVSCDPSLLCGLIARVGHVIYDMSLKSKLDRMQLQLEQRI